MVVLTGYKTVKQALVNHAEEFGDRDITPLFHDLNKGLGKAEHRFSLLCYSWGFWRLFAFLFLTNCEEKQMSELTEKTFVSELGCAIWDNNVIRKDVPEVQ